MGMDVNEWHVGVGLGENSVVASAKLSRARDVEESAEHWSMHVKVTI